METHCGHLICDLLGRGCRLAVSNDYGIGGPIGPTAVPRETLEEVRLLLANLDQQAIKAELARRKLERDLEALARIVEEEKRACHRTQSMSSIRERSTQLLDKLADIRSVEDLDKPL